jgi:methionyl-tRNA formyltransferase
MRIALVGAVESSLVALRTLIEKGHAPLAVVTLPLAKASRHSDFVDLRPAAAAQEVSVIEAANVNSPEVVAQIRQLNPDFIFVIGWSQICGPEFLRVPRHGCIGYHPSLLPENRGRAVIAWTILQGLDRSGGSLFWLAEGVDSGDLLIQRELAVAPEETARTLMDKHLQLLQEVLRDALALLANGNSPRIAQDASRATYCAQRTAADGWIDWTKPARDIWTLTRAAGKPYPGAFTVYNRRKLTVWSADLAAGRPFWGMPGQIQEITPAGALVQCGNREHVLLKLVQLDEGPEELAATAGFKIHSRLGVNGFAATCVAGATS